MYTLTRPSVEPETSMAAAHALKRTQVTSSLCASVKQQSAAPVRAAVAKLTDAAKRGDRVAKLELSALRTTQTAHTKLRNKIVTAVIAARGAKTPAERAAAEAIALKRYLPSANLALSKYHPKMQALVSKAAPVIAAAAKAKAAKAAKALPAKAR